MSDDALSCTTSIFEQPWWLDAVAPGRWHAATVEKRGEIVARLTFVMERKRGLTHIRNAPLTQVNGPYLKITAQKKAKRISQEIQLLEELIDQIPSHDSFRLNLSPDLQDWLPFHWAGYTQSTRYTYRLDDLGDIKAIWQGMNKNIRTDIRKARNSVEVRDEGDLETLLDLNAMTFARQGRRPPHDRSLMRRLDQAASEHGARHILTAVDADGNAHAAAYLVYDERTCYYLIGGGDPEHRNSGATSLVLWEAIRFASTVSRSFDFEGSMLRPVERFFRAFGARQTPFYSLNRQSRRLSWLSSLREALPPWH